MLGAIAAGAGLAGGLLGGSAQAKGARDAANAQKAALDYARILFEEVGLPPDLSAPIILEQLAVAGQLTPELEQAITLQASEMSKVQEDKSLRDSQVKALRQMSQYGKAGLTPEERAEANKARQGVQRDLEAKQQQIIQNLAMRGQAGGGAEIAARMLSSQEGADRASEEADRISALASARALQAISNEASMAGALRGQDFDVNSARAQATDEFNRFNTEAQIGRQTRNVGSKNAAQEYNLSNLQRIRDENVAVNNQEKLRQAEAKRQNWLDRMSYAGAKAGIAQNYGAVDAQQAQAIGQNKANMWSSLGGGVGAGLGAVQNQNNFSQLMSLFAKQRQQPNQAGNPYNSGSIA